MKKRIISAAVLLLIALCVNAMLAGLLALISTGDYSFIDGFCRLFSICFFAFGGGFVFTENSKPLPRSRIDFRLKRICKDIGIQPLTIHSLRHTFATRCIENGMKPKTLQMILGHSSLAITMDLYVHVTDNELLNEIDRFVI